MDFCKNLKQYRQHTGCTQGEMAEMLGITVRAYRNYELGRNEPSLSFLIMIADKFEISLDDLVGRKFPK